MKRLLTSVILAAALLLVPLSGVVALLITAGAVQAATSENVTVTAIPGFVGITNSPADWIINGISGSGVISTDTTYYANTLAIGDDTSAPVGTVGDDDCRFEMINTSTVNATVTINFGDFVGGDTMTNSDNGSNGATSFGAYSYYSGGTWPGTKVVAETPASGSDPLMSNLVTTGNLTWGVEIITRLDEWQSTDQMSANVTITATVSGTP